MFGLEFGLKKLQEKNYKPEAFKNYKELKERGALRHEGKKIVLDTHKLTEEEKQELLNWLKQDRKKTIKRTVYIGALLLVIVCAAFGFTYSSWQNKKETERLEAERQQRLLQEKADFDKQREQQKHYPFFMREAAKYLAKGEFHNSAFQYREALKAYPKDKAASIGLARAYTYRCWIEGKNCEEASQILSDIQGVVDNAELNNLKDTFNRIKAGQLSLIN